MFPEEAKRRIRSGCRSLKRRLQCFAGPWSGGNAVSITGRGVPVAVLRPIAAEDHGAPDGLLRASAQLRRRTRSGPEPFRTLRDAEEVNGEPQSRPRGQLERNLAGFRPIRKEKLPVAFQAGGDRVERICLLERHPTRDPAALPSPTRSRAEPPNLYNLSTSSRTA